MKTITPVYRCDTPGCKSTCTLSATSDADAAELTKRGWVVATAPDKDTISTTYCPGCAASGKIPVPAGR